MLANLVKTSGVYNVKWNYLFAFLLHIQEAYSSEELLS